MASCLATTAVWRGGSTSTLVTNSIRSVIAARWANSTRISWNTCSFVYGADGNEPNGPGPSRSALAPSTWSYASRWSKPAASAVRTHVRIASGSVPLSACEKITPICMCTTILC